MTDVATRESRSDYKLSERMVDEQCLVPAELLKASRAMFSALPDPLVLVQASGQIGSFNEAAQQIFGYTQDEVWGKNLSLLLPREVTGANDEAFARLIANLRRPDTPVLRTRARRADGVEIPVDLRVKSIYLVDHEIFVLSLRDISDRLDTEERLRALGEELAHAVRVNAMGEMAAGIAHELNQPLAALANYLEAAKQLLSTEELKDPRAEEMIDAAARQAIRAGAIIRRIRKFVTRGEIDIRVEPVEETVRDAINLVFVGRAQFDVKVNVAFDRDADRMLADRIQVQQVLVNLLRNALEALQPLPPDARNILVKARRTDDMIEFNVLDTGPGIPQTVLDRLYEPFSSTKGSGGMGVGLTISRRIIEAHGGRIWAENRAEGGAAFRFTVPALKDQQQGARKR